jgi:peptidoglycan hydrolase-like protein with peptidoglycan-binding domain
MTLQFGTSGPEVLAWQRALLARGYSVGEPDGVFGKRTHNATCAFQAGAGLEVTGEVTTRELQVMAAPSVQSLRPPPVLAHTIPYVPARFHGSKPRKVLDHIVLHCMEAPEASTRAERCAENMAALPPDLPKSKWKSFHYAVDSDTVIQGVRDHLVAYAAPGANHNGLQIEHAGYARQTRDEWLDDFGRRMLWLSAQLVARKCRERDIPIQFVRAAELLAKPQRRGITTHHEVSLAFKRSNHHDPGPNFPMAWYLEQVHLAYDAAEGIV